MLLPDDPAALKAMIAHLQAENTRISAANTRVQADIEKMSATLRVHEALVQALQIQIARLKKQKFGASSGPVRGQFGACRARDRTAGTGAGASGDCRGGGSQRDCT